MPNLPITASSTATATFCLIMDKLFDICHECQQHNSLDTCIETTWSTIFVNWWFLVFVAKISNFNLFSRLCKNNWSMTRTIRKVRETKKNLCNDKSIQSIKIIKILSWNKHIKFLIIHKVSCVLAKRFCQGPLEAFFCKQHPHGAWKDKLTFLWLWLCQHFSKPKKIQAINSSK